MTHTGSNEVRRAGRVYVGLLLGTSIGSLLFAMSLSAALCVFIGSFPWPLYSLLPFLVDYQPYDLTHVISQLQLLFFSALALTWLKLSGLYPPELRSVNLDAEWAYRWLVPRFIRKAAAVGGPTRHRSTAQRDAACRDSDRGVVPVSRSPGPFSPVPGLPVAWYCGWLSCWSSTLSFIIFSA